MDVDIPAVGVIFVITMIIVGQFFLMNLILAVIIFSFIKVQKKDLEDEIKKLMNEDIKLETLEDQQTNMVDFGKSMKNDDESIGMIKEEPEEDD
jgi:hypothetical protein